MRADDLDEPPPPRRAARRIGCLASLVVLAVLVVGLVVVWANRKSIADDFIASQFADLGIAATYDIERIGGRYQVLTNIVVGDPRRPDLTIARADVYISPRLGFPRISAVKLTRPRLYGTLRRGTLSFGALDPLLFPPKTEEPFRLPDWSLEVVDGGGRIDSDYGPIGLSLKGKGKLRGGFAGELGGIAPRLAGAGCEATRASLYGRLMVEAERPRLAGPLRLGRLTCGAGGIDVAGAALQLDARVDQALKVFEGEGTLRTAALGYGANRLAGLDGTVRASWRDGGLTGRYELAGRGLATAALAASRVTLDGSLRARRQFARIEIDADVDGSGVRLGPALDATLADAARGTADTLLGPLLAQVRARLAAEGRASRFVGSLSLRRSDGRTSLAVPEAALRGSSGATLLALSRVRMVTGGAAPRLWGNFSTGGAGLPRLVGRMEQRADGGIEARFAMAEYAAGNARLALPELAVVQRADGVIGFSGTARASGVLPGGMAEGLVLPVSGRWSPNAGLAVWSQCTSARFDRLRFANLTLERQALTLCPPRGQSIVRYDGRRLRVAAGAPSLQLAGRLGETPIAIRSGPVGLAWPGALSARQVQVALGPAATATRFVIEDLTADIGQDIAGRFAGTDVRLFAVPLDLLGASGTWRYANGRLSIADGAFRLVDRQQPGRFTPLVAQGATLALENNRVTAAALLREPAGNRLVTELALVHDLATASGHADLNIPGLAFGPGFQPDALFPAAFGVVANVNGTVTGTGRIDWIPAGVTSRGRFSSDALDFAAAFGPVKGASGTIEFSDLLGLTTAPNQRLRIASINPGIEVTDGEIGIELRGGQVLAVTGGRWPFMGGTLTMRPVDIRFGAAEVRRYVLEIEGLDAAKFVEYMELNNISATGIFDGTLSLVFDESGNGRVEDGLLLSRAPGGNVSYVGELTYQDMGVMANFAFDTLRSLDYRQMNVAIEGPLTGEIVTRLRLDGVSQGAGAKQSIVTRAIAGLPIRLQVNIRAPFYSLITNIRSMYDPSAVRDPRDLGLIDAAGTVIRRETTGPPPEPVTPTDLIPDEATIQRRESEVTP